jgi:hypothetical protein
METILQKVGDFYVRFEVSRPEGKFRWLITSVISLGILFVTLAMGG